MKTIYDPLHGFIRLDDLEEQWIKTPWFLRLQSIHQLGVAYRVFPGAKHTRFEHSLGVMHLATKIFDHLFLNDHLGIFDAAYFQFYRKIIRLAALSHDLGHLPFSHLAEKIVFPESCHEEWTLKILGFYRVIDFLQPLINEGKKLNIDVIELLKKIAVGEKKYKKPFTSIELILTEIITGDFFGADRMDYLLRDAKATGLSYGFFDHEQLIMSLLLGFNPSLCLMIDHKGIQACESLLVARYFMYERLYLNLKIQAYGFDMQNFVKEVLTKNNGLDSVENYLRISDVEVLAYARSVCSNETSIEALPVSDKQIEKLKNHNQLKNILSFKTQSGSKSFFKSNFYVKTPYNKFIPFKNYSKLKIPQVNENFVLFEKGNMSSVLEVIFQEILS